MITRRTTSSLMLVALLAIDPARALDGWTSCHAAGTTVTSISGFDTRTAKMVSVVTLPDAMEDCHREDHLNGAALTACANKQMRAESDSFVTVWANCEKGTLTVEQSPGKYVRHYKFPVVQDCGEGNTSAIAAFERLCPNYEGKVEDEGDGHQ